METSCRGNSATCAETADFTSSDRPLLLSNWSVEEKMDRQDFYEKKASRLKDTFYTCQDTDPNLKNEKGQDNNTAAPQEPQEDVNNNLENKEQNAASDSDSASVRKETVGLQDFVTAQREKAMSSGMVDRGSSGRRWRKRKFSKEKFSGEQQKKQI